MGKNNLILFLAIAAMLMTLGCRKNKPNETYFLSLSSIPNDASTLLGQGVYEEGEIVSLIAIPNGNYQIKGWTDDQGQLLGDSNQISFTMPARNVVISATFSGYYSTVNDVSGNTYPTILLLGREWMAKNLMTTKYRNGESIPTDLDMSGWRETRAGAYAIYHHAGVKGISSAQEMLDAYGALYNYYAVEDPRGLCPEGWRIPTHEELFEFLNSLGEHDIVGGKLKSTRTYPDLHPRWNSPNEGATNELLFEALPGGNRDQDGLYFGLGEFGAWWFQHEPPFDPGFQFHIYYHSQGWGGASQRSNTGLSIRCVKDLTEE